MRSTIRISSTRLSSLARLAIAGFVSILVFSKVIITQPNGFADRPAKMQTITDSQSHTLIRVEPQRFEMGGRETQSFRVDHPDYNSDGDERPIHPVIISRPFYIATHEVTRRQFATFIRETGYQTTAQRSGQGIVGWKPVDDEEHERILQSFEQDAAFDWANPGFEQNDFHPVVGVSHDDAVAYCQWISKLEGKKYRLPTEAEWECACRAGSNSYFSFGEEYVGAIERYANIAHAELEAAHRDRAMVQWLVDTKTETGDGFVFTAPTGSLEANPWGIYDMHGNVWEWCQDRYLDTFYDQFERPAHRELRKRAVDPVCDEKWNNTGQWRVIRGGSWINAPVQARSAVRGFFEASDAACYLGFRVVREAEEEAIRQARLRYLASDTALRDMIEIARGVREDNDGHIHLEFQCEGLTPKHLEPLSRIQDSLQITLSPPGMLDESMINAVCDAPNLNGVAFRSGGSELSEKSYARLAEHPELQRVQITGVGGLGNELVAAIQSAERLVSIHLQGENIDEIGLIQLVPSRTLETVRLSATRSTGHFLRAFAGSPLRAVSFSHLDDEGAQILSDFPSLREVSVDGGGVSDDGVVALAKLQRLQNLGLRNCPDVTDSGFVALSSLAFLERLDLRGCNLGPEGLAQLRLLNRLRHLELDINQLDADRFSDVSAITSLRELAIRSPTANLPPSTFSSIWQLTNLSSLHLEIPQLSGQAIAPLVECPKLERLTLASSLLDSTGLDHLSLIKDLRELTIGDWSREPSKQLTAESLSVLCQSKSLRRVALIRYGDQISEQQIADLKRRNDEIEWSCR